MKGARPLRSTRRITNLGQRPGWFNIRNAAEDDSGPLMVHIYDEIGMWGVSAQDFIRDLAQRAGDIELHVNSPGGDIFDGIAIYNLLKQRTEEITCIVDGLAASAASFIIQAASPGKLFVSPHAQVMIHDGFAMAIGNAADMRQTADLLDKASENIASIYAERTGRDVSYWRAAMKAETWYSDQEAVDAGLADSIHGVEGVAASWDLSVFNLGPRLRGAAAHPPHTGRHTHSHPAFGHHGDGSSEGSESETHEHEHEHNNDNNHDHHQTERESGASDLNQLILNAAVDESAWDGPAAMKAASNSDSPGKAFASICAGRREGPADERESWALPHHKHPGDAPNAHGVANALARISSTEGLTNESAARKHLEDHMKTINPDWEPSGSEDLAILFNEVQEALNGA